MVNNLYFYDAYFISAQRGLPLWNIDLSLSRHTGYKITNELGKKNQLAYIYRTFLGAFFL